MRHILFGAAASAMILAGGTAMAQSQGDSGQQPAPKPPSSESMAGQGEDMPMMGQDTPMMGMMMRHHMGQGMMMGGDYGGHHRMGHRGMPPHMILMIMAMIDTNGNGTLSLEEIQAVHARLFGYVDQDGDGELTVQEIRGFMQDRPETGEEK